MVHGPVLLLSAVLALCAARPGPPSATPETVTCSGDKHVTRSAIQHINDNHHHGFKFQLTEVTSSQVKQDGEGCEIVLQLSLQETQCHVLNPEHFENCVPREHAHTKVMANCTVVLSVENSVASVISYTCETTKDNTLSRMCPDCPMLMPLSDPEGLKYIQEAFRAYNANNATEHYFVLRDVGRITSMQMPSMEMTYVSHFAMVETHCVVGTRMAIEACKPLCTDRARHVFCRSTNDQLECETYPAVNQTAVEPEREPVCRHPHHHTLFTSRPRVVPQIQQAVDPLEGLPPHIAVQRPMRPGHPNDICTGGMVDPAIHPICTWPHPQHPQPRI